jgi:hypothetical protein
MWGGSLRSLLKKKNRYRPTRKTVGMNGFYNFSFAFSLFGIAFRLGGDA